MEYSFNLYNSLAPSGEVIALKKLLNTSQNVPVILCIGTVFGKVEKHCKFPENAVKYTS